MVILFFFMVGENEVNFFGKEDFCLGCGGFCMVIRLFVKVNE